MLDTRDPIVLDDVGEVIVYRDDSSKTVFYALPAKPRLALDDQGKPQLSLIAYGRQGPTGFKARGGVLALTTALQLTSDELERVRKSLAKRLAREFPQPGGAPPLAPDLRPIEWVKGAVDLTIVPGVTASGSPSMYGSNQFSMNANLDVQQVADVLHAWERGLPDASITYHLTARIAPARTTTTHTTSYQSFAVDEIATSSTISSSARESSGGTSNPDMELTGPLLPRGADPRQFLNLQSF